MNLQQEVKILEKQIVYLQKNNATWYHHQDGKTLQEVPTKIHTQFTHRGGFSISKRGKE